MPIGCGYGIAFLRMKLIDPHGMKHISVASLIPYIKLLAYCKWNRRDVETCQVKLDLLDSELL